MNELQKELEHARHDLKNAKQRVALAEEAIISANKEAIDKELSKRETPTGTVSIDNVKITYPKRVEWNQDMIANLYKEIGETASEYIDVSYKVKEKEYGSWGENIKQCFEPARTVKVGKPTIKFVESE